MPHVSKRNLSDSDFNKIYEQLTRVFNTAGDKRESDRLFDEFFTKTEKVMFAKRLAIIFLLSEGVSIHYISQILAVSPSTVEKMNLKYEIGKYPYISKLVTRNKEDIWKVMSRIISSMPRRAGKSRWDWVEKIEEKYKNKNYK